MKLTVMEAKNLLATDSAFMSKKATSSDPFIRVAIPNAQNYKMESIGQTKVIKKNLNPKWKNEEFTIRMKESHAPHIYLSIYDHDQSSGDDPLGQVIIDANNLMLEADNSTWLEILPCQKCDEPTGMVKVKCEYKPVPKPKFPIFFGGKLGIKICEAIDLIACDNDSMFSKGKCKRCIICYLKLMFASLSRLAFSTKVSHYFGFIF